MLDKDIFGEVPEVVHNAVLNALDSLEEDSNAKGSELYVVSEKQKKKNVFSLSRVAAACFVCFLISGITVSAVKAVSLYRQRMEEMNENLLEEYYSIASAAETTQLSRTFTREERERFEQLNEEYEKNGLFPQEQITYLENEDEYSGKGIALEAEKCMLYLPEEELSDEELLEIIDFEHKICYSIYEKNEERIANGDNWQSRMQEMDDQQVDEVYFTMFSSNTEISGGYNRQLSEEENIRYEELVKCYEEEGLFATSELSVIQTAEEYTGVGAAICVSDSTFYIPETEPTDEDFLQIIDFQHKVTYCLDRISQEIDMGFRQGYPEP